MLDPNLGSLVKVHLWNPDTLDWEAFSGFPITVGELVVSGVAVSNFPSVQTVDGTVTAEGFVNSEGIPYLLKLEEASAVLTYVGEALPDSGDDAAAWRIKRLDSTSGMVVAWADGSSAFDKIWDSRTNYDYS